MSVHRTKTILSLATLQPIASAGFLPGSTTWPWISETVAAECQCEPDQVSVTEDPERGDLLTVDGLPVFILC